jgi:hypothetical protein
MLRKIISFIRRDEYTFDPRITGDDIFRIMLSRFIPMLRGLIFIGGGGGGGFFIRKKLKNY